MGIAVEVRAGLEQEPLLGQATDDLVRRLARREAVQPAVGVVETARLVDRREHREVVEAPELEVLLACARRDVDDAGSLLERDLVPRDDPVVDLAAGAEVVEGTAVAKTHELLSEGTTVESLVGIPGDGDPLAVLAPPVLRFGLDRRGDVRRQRPGRRRPDDQRLIRSLEEREADVERRVAPLLIHACLGELVLRERGAATWAPLRRAVTEVEPVARVHELQEPPDVLDVRVAEREVVVPPVHPLTEPDRALGQRSGGLHDHLPATSGELGEPVLLDLPLRVETERALDAHLDPEPLAVESVLVALVVPAERLVPLEDVLQRPPPGGVDAEHHPVGGHRAVDEAEPGAVGVPLTELPEGLLALPELEDRALERVVIRLVRERCEHAVDSRRCLGKGFSRRCSREGFSDDRRLHLYDN